MDVIEEAEATIRHLWMESDRIQRDARRHSKKYGYQDRQYDSYVSSRGAIEDKIRDIETALSRYHEQRIKCEGARCKLAAVVLRIRHRDQWGHPTYR